MLRPALEQLRGKHNLIGVEIGVFRGIYASDYLKELDIKKVYLIDPYKPYGDYYTSKIVRGAKKMAHAVLFPHRRKTKWIKAKAAEIAVIFDDGSLDFVYVDGNHTYQAVLEDIALYYPKVKKGGLICGHDYRPEVRENVFDAVNEFCKKHNLKLNADIDSTDWWIWR